MVSTTKTKAHRKLVAELLVARRSCGMRQTEVAKKLRVSQTWIARIESGERRVDVIEFVKLCKLFRLDPHKLLDLVIRSRD